MSPKLFRSDETKQWLQHAREDLSAAELLLSVQPPLLKIALFHCQQSVEKALKGYLVWQEQSFPITHNLVQLGKQCATQDATLAEKILPAVGLTQYAVRFRYPGEQSEPGVEEARRWLEVARLVLAAVVMRLPEEFRSSTESP